MHDKKPPLSNDRSWADSELLTAPQWAGFGEQFLKDLRLGLRMLWRNRGISSVAILCLTVAIAANGAVFSWVEGILLRPFPLVAHQERMMAITGTMAGVAGPAGNSQGLSWPDFVDLAKNTTSFDAFIVSRITGASLALGDRATNATGSIVSSNYFDALGVHPILGRGFHPEEDYGRNAHPVAVISYQLWKERFGSDRNVIGRTQLFNGMPHTIIGVAPEGFVGTFVGWAMQFWVPVSMQERFDSAEPGYKLENRAARWIEGYVLLKQGVTPERAQQEISAVGRQLERNYPDINRGRNVKLFPLWQTPFNNAGTLLPTLGIALAVVAFLLLIACANASNLMLVKAFARQHEMMVRLSMGARRGRLIRQLLTEALVLTIAAAFAGFVLAYWCRNLLVVLLPRRGAISMNLPGQIDWRVLAVGAAVCVATTVLIGLLPALQASRVEIASALKTESASVMGTHGKKAVVRSVLVMTQVSLSFLLLTGAGLLIRSLHAIQGSDPGFVRRGLLTTSVDLLTPGYDTQRAKNFQDELIDRLLSVPGIQSAAFARKTPLTYRAFSSAAIAVDTYRPAPDEQLTLDYNEVGPGYFATVGVPMLAGRDFTRQDDERAPLVAIVNDTMAAKYWQQQDPIGTRLGVNGRWMRVIGIVKTAKYWNLTENPTPFFYVPLRQNFALETDLNIRTALSSEEMTKVLAREMRALDPGLVPYGVITIEEQLNRATSIQRAAVMMISTFGALAMALAAIGLYSVLASTVAQRRRELGLRMALGAGPARLLGLVMSQGFVLVVAGLMVGAMLAVLSTRLLGYLLYRVSPRDPVAFFWAFAVMIAVSLAACWLPAWRASRSDPMQALRT